MFQLYFMNLLVTFDQTTLLCILSVFSSSFVCPSVVQCESKKTIPSTFMKHILRWLIIITRRPASADRTSRRQFQATGQPVSRTQPNDAMMSRCRTMRRSVCNAGASNAGQSLCVQISRQRSYPLPIYWYHSKGNWLRNNFAADNFYIMKLCSRLFVLCCRNCPKDDKFRSFIPILRKLGAA